MIRRSITLTAAVASMMLGVSTPAVAAPPDPSGTVAITPSGVVATAVSLSAGQLVDNDNRSNSAVPPGTSSTLRTGLSTSAATLSVGATTTVKAGDVGTARDSGGYPTTPLASGTTTAYPSAARFFTSDNNDVVTESLTVVGPHRSRVIPNIIISEDRYGAAWRPSLSGNRLTYLQQTGTGTPAFFVYDVAKDTATRLLDFDPTSENEIPVPAVSGNYVAIAKPDASVTRENLNTGTTTVVSPADPIVDGAVQTSVFARGDYVGWTHYDQTGTDDDDVVSGYRNAAAGDTPVTLTDALAGFAAVGPITATYHDPDRTERFVLHTFAGPVVDLPAIRIDYDRTHPIDDDVFVEGRTVAWIDVPAGTVKVAAVDVTPAAPRMAGDTLAPKPANPSEVVWHAYAPFSEPLTSCSVAVMSGAKTVTTLSCNKSEMAIGVADVEWNGKIGSHRASAGTYHYEITSAGDGGASLDSDGHAQPVAGHFVVPRP